MHPNEALSLRSCEWGILKHDKIRLDYQPWFGVKACIADLSKGCDGRGETHSSSLLSFPYVQCCNRSRSAGQKDRQEGQVVWSTTACGLGPFVFIFSMSGKKSCTFLIFSSTTFPTTSTSAVNAPVAHDDFPWRSSSHWLCDSDTRKLRWAETFILDLGNDDSSIRSEVHY